ncbi:uncharacterized protein [Medicago truncatula]|uniref:uncharacterized protein n=1 Tax=Medicago truncatula TaxID=3880 RepID=UPI000D2F2D53|nr:uncharacterized protein LOC112421949 [Medicago truncatula]
MFYTYPGGYTVRGAYDLLTIQEAPMAELTSKLVWHNQVPLKVYVFAWRLIRDRLPTKSNLVTIRVLSADMASCIVGCGLSETAQHLFFSCDTFGSIWRLARDWIGFYGVDFDDISDHLQQFTHMTGGGKARCSFQQLIWLLYVWVVWNERNNRLFNNIITHIPRLLNKVKMLSLGWLKAKKSTFTFGT